MWRDAAFDPSANGAPITVTHCSHAGHVPAGSPDDLWRAYNPPAPTNTHIHGGSVRLLTPLVWGSPWITARPSWSHISLSPAGSAGASEGGFYCKGPLWQPWSTRSPSTRQARLSPPADLRLVHERRLAPHEWSNNGDYTERSWERRCAARLSAATPPTGGTSKWDVFNEFIQEGGRTVNTTQHMTVNTTQHSTAGFMAFAGGREPHTMCTTLI